MEKINFEDFLRRWHGKGYMGTDDDMPDAYDVWSSELETDDLIPLANIYAMESYTRGYHKATRNAISIIKS